MPFLLVCLSATTIDRVCETGRPPSEDWNVRVAVTDRPRSCLSAASSALLAETLGLITKLIVPAAATIVPPLAKTTFAWEHLPLSLTRPVLHFALLTENTPNLLFWKVSSQLNVPGSLTDTLNTIAPVLRLMLGLPNRLKLLSAIGVYGGMSALVSAGIDVTGDGDGDGNVGGDVDGDG